MVILYLFDPPRTPKGIRICEYRLDAGVTAVNSNVLAVYI